MKKQLAYVIIAASVIFTSLALTTGCSSSSHAKQTANSYQKDKEIAAHIKSRLNADPTTKSDEIDVQCLNGSVQLSGFVDSQAAKDRAGQIAGTERGVFEVHNALLLPTGP